MTAKKFVQLYSTIDNIIYNKNKFLKCISIFKMYQSVFGISHVLANEKQVP
jgi:hypothetical protein